MYPGKIKPKQTKKNEEKTPPPQNDKKHKKKWIKKWILVFDSNEKLAGGLNVVGGNGELPASHLNCHLPFPESCDVMKSISHLPRKYKQLKWEL